jgi:hypothetical protein
MYSRVNDRLTHPDDLVFSTGREEFAVGAEAHTPDVEVSIFRQAAVLEMCDWVSGIDLEDLSRAVAASGYKAAVETEAHTAHDALVGKVVDQVNVQHTLCARIEDGEPILALLLKVLWQLLNIQVGQDIALGQ